MLEAEINNEGTILDYLNEDCWRAVLEYVPIRDLIRTESSSRLWQMRVLQYLQGVRISIMDGTTGYSYMKAHYNSNTSICSVQKLKFAKHYESFAMWINKIGPSVVATYCNNLETLIKIRESCPNLEYLMFDSMHNRCSCCGLLDVFPYNLNTDFKCLRGLIFYSCNISDHCINQFIADKALKKLEILDCEKVKGDFFNTINLSNLKTLAIEDCYEIELEHLLSAVEHLGELTKLVLKEMLPDETSIGIQPVLDKMPKLEYLIIYEYWDMACHDYEPLLRLSRLKHLELMWEVPDECVEAILQGCKELRYLDLGACAATTTRAVVEALRRWGARLRSLTLLGLNGCEDDDLVAIISACPELELLRVGLDELSLALPARAAAARRAVRTPGAPRLRLDVEWTNLVDEKWMKHLNGDYEPINLEYEDLIVILDLF